MRSMRIGYTPSRRLRRELRAYFSNSHDTGARPGAGVNDGRWAAGTSTAKPSRRWAGRLVDPELAQGFGGQARPPMDG